MTKTQHEVALAQALKKERAEIKKRVQAWCQRNYTSRADEYGTGWNHAVDQIGLAFK